MLLTLTSEDLPTVVGHGSVVQVTGTDEDGARVTFAGDHRVMAGMLEALEVEGELPVYVEDWQITRTVQP